MRLFDAWVLSRLVSGQRCDEFIDATHPRFRPVAKYLAETDRSSRSIAFGCYLAGQGDRDEVCKAVADADPLGPAPSLTAERRPASALDLDQAAFGVQWAWPGWIPRGRVCGVGGFEGTGKTRFALDLARRAYHGLPWPDGQPMTLPSGSKSLWICGDGHQEEIAGAARKMNLPLNAVLFNASPEDPCTGVDLDDPAAIESLDAFLEISAAPLGLHRYLDQLDQSRPVPAERRQAAALALARDCTAPAGRHRLAAPSLTRGPGPRQAHQGPDPYVDPPRVSRPRPANAVAALGRKVV